MGEESCSPCGNQETETAKGSNTPLKGSRSELYFLPSRSYLLSFLPPPNMLLLVDQGFH